MLFQKLISPFRNNINSVSFVASAVVQASNSPGTSTAITLPASIQANDIIVVFCDTGTSTSATAPTQTTPTGYTLIDSAVASNTPQADADRANLYYKIAVAGDAGATLTITHGTSNFRATIVAVFRTSKGSYPIIRNTSINSYGVTTTTNQAANPPNQTVTSGSGNVPLIVFGSYVNYSTRSFTPTEDGDITSNNSRCLRYKIYNSSPVDVTVGSATTGTVITMQSFSMEIFALEDLANIWLSASTLSGLSDGTKVSSWTNLGKDGATFNATGTSTAPIKTTLSGYPVLEFNATTDFVLDLANAFTATSDFSVFIVGYQTANRLIGFGGASPNGNSFWGYSGNNGVSVLLRNTSDAGLTVSSQTSVTGLKAYGIVKTSTTSTTTYDNGTTGVGRAGISGNFIFGRIGMRDGFSGQRSTGYISEVLYFNYALSASEAATVMANLKQRNGIA